MGSALRVAYLGSLEIRNWDRALVKRKQRLD
jgi:hypothetical protein